MMIEEPEPTGGAAAILMIVLMAAGLCACISLVCLYLALW